MDDPNRIPTEEEVQPVLEDILEKCDFEHTTLKIIMEVLSEQLFVNLENLKPRKKYIRSEVEKYMENNYKPKPETPKSSKRKTKKESKMEDEIANGEDEEDEEVEEEEEEESEHDSDDNDEGETKSRKSNKRRASNGEWIMKYGTKGHKVTLTNLEKAVVLAEPLAEFLGVKVIQRTHAAKRITEYVKEHNLQDPADRRNIKSDEALETLFGVSEFTFFTVNKMLAPLLLKRNDVNDKELHELCDKCESDALKEKQRIYDDKVENGEPIGKTRARGNSSNNGGGRATKKSRRNSTSNSNGEKRKQPDYKLSKQLAEVCGGDIMPRTQVIKQIWAYIKANQLSQGGMIRPDNKLKNICQGVEEMRNFDINKYLSAHLTKL